MTIAFICPRSVPALIGQKVSLPVGKIKDEWFQELIVGNGIVTHLAIQDSTLFKKITGRTKVVNTAGYVFPAKYGNYHVVYVPPSKTMTLDKRVADEGWASVNALVAHLEGRYVEPGSTKEVIVHWDEPFTKWSSILMALPVISVDVETTGLKHYKSDIRTIGFGISDGEAVVFHFEKVEFYLREFFEQYAGRIVMHKAAFDITQLIHKLWMKNLTDTEGLYQGLIHLQSKVHCSLILSYVVTNTCAGNELGLKPQTQAVYGNYGIEETWIAPLEEIVPYNAKDCAATLWLYNKHLLSLSPLETVFEQLNSYLREVVWMQLCGLPINHEVAVRNAAILTGRQAELHRYIADHPVIARYMVMHRDDWAEKKNAKYKKKRVKPEDCNEQFNPGSHLQLQQLFYVVMELPIISLTATKQPSTDGDTIKALIHHTEEKALLEAFIEISQVDKLISSFIPHFVEAPDTGKYNCMFGFYNIGGTQSGRLSCVAEWTRVQTQRGLIPIIQLQPGDMAWTHQRRWRRITHLIQKPVEQMVDIQFSSGYILTCTIAHKLKLPNGRWASVQEIIDEHIEDVDWESFKHSSSSNSCSNQSHNDFRFIGSIIGNYLSQCASYFKEALTCRRIHSIESVALLDLQGRRQESNEGSYRRTMPSLDRGNRRWLWLPHHSSRGHTALCTSTGNGSSIGIGSSSRDFRCAPYRREPKEQPHRQSGISNQCRSSTDSCTSSDESGGKIQAINYRGSLPVWDITVEEDHSYWAEGCFSHNSDSPNQQNLPSSGNPYAVYIKEMVEAPKGWWFVGADFSSLEDKIMTLLTRDPNREKVYIDGYDGHSLRAFSYFRNQMPDIEDTLDSINSIGKKYKSLRQDSKAPTFALTYAGTWSTLVKNCGFTEEMAKQIEANFHELYKVSTEWSKAKLAIAAEQGFTDLAFGLRLYTPILHASIHGNARPKEASDEERSAGNAFGQSYGLLNSRAAHGFMDKVIEAKLWNDIKPAAQIHDACYFWIRRSVKLLKWVNDTLIPEMEWDELPELKHPQIKLGGNLIIYSPNWSTDLSIPNGASYGEIGDIVNGIK